MINIGTLLLLIIMFHILLRNKNLKDIYINIFCLTGVVELAIERGYFLQIGNQQIAYRTFCEFVLFAISFFMLLKFKIKRAYCRNILLTLCGLIIGWILLLIFPSNATGATFEVSWDSILAYRLNRVPIRFNSGMILEIIQIFMFFVILLNASQSFKIEDWKRALSKLSNWMFYVVFFTSFEVINNYLLKSNIYFTIVDGLLGSSIATVADLYSRGNGYVLCGLTKEASHYAFCLSVILILLTVNYLYNDCNLKFKKRFLLCGLIILIELLLSMSFSTIYYVSCLILLLFCIRYEKKGHSSIKLILVIVMSLVALIFIVAKIDDIAALFGMDSFWGRRLYSVSEELQLISSSEWLTAVTALEWSNRVRLGSTFETIKLVFYRPLFGLGLSSATAHSSFAMLLAGAGFIGTFLYLKSMFGWVRKVVESYNKSLFITCVLVYLTMTLLNSLSLRPFYESWSILLAFSFGLLSEKGHYIGEKFDVFE